MAQTFENFGKYVLLEKLAMGGMAEVYLAKSVGANGVSKFVALKRILPQYSDNQEFVEMFKEEAKIAVNLNHSNVVSIFDFGIEKSQFFLVMEYVEGRNLRQILNHLKKLTNHFNVDQIVYMIKEVAAGLDHAHRCLDGATGRPLNINHRDISPQNIMISFEGEIKIVDFGIAKAENKAEATKAGTLKGKYGYMSPEQADGANIDLRTDIFSLGIVLWELLANERLFTANNDLNILKKIRDCQIPSLRKINPNIHPELERICNKALAKDPSLRYQTASALHRDLNRFLNTQYPEFSAHDFSVFMKTIFSQTVIENRKKLVEYAKIVVNAPTAQEKTEVTATLTHPSVNNLDDIPMPPKFATASEDEPKLNISSGDKVVNLNELKMSNDKLFKPTTPHPRNKDATSVTRTYNTRATGMTQEGSIQFTMYYLQKKVFGPIINLMITLIVIGGAYFLFQEQINIIAKELYTQYKYNGKKAPVGTTTQAAKGKTQVLIQTSPESSEGVSKNLSDAQIYINGALLPRVTPTSIEYEINKPIRITVMKEGYVTQDRVELITDKNNNFNFKMVSGSTSYLNIDVKNSSPETFIMIDGKRISEKPPIRTYYIKSNKITFIKAWDPTAQKIKEVTVNLEPGQKKYVEIDLAK